MSKVYLEKVRGDLAKDGVDVFFHIVVGQNKVKTELIESAKKDFTQDWKLPFYAEARENKVTLALWDRNMFSNFSNTVYAVGHIPLPTTSGEKKVEVFDAEGNSQGHIYVTMTSEKVASRTINLTDIKVKTLKSADILGSSDLYIIAKIGGWAARTETGEGNEFAFKKGLELKFDKEPEVVFEVWDEDIDANDKLFTESYKISDLKEKKGEINIPLKDPKGENGGNLSMKYTTKNVKHDSGQGKTNDRKKEDKSLTDRKKSEK